jgi:hypothetical protein
MSSFVTCILEVMCSGLMMSQSATLLGDGEDDTLVHQLVERQGRHVGAAVCGVNRPVEMGARVERGP